MEWKYYYCDTNYYIIYLHFICIYYYFCKPRSNFIPCMHLYLLIVRAFALSLSFIFSWDFSFRWRPGVCSDLRLIAALEMLRGLRTHSSNFANYSTPAIQSCTKLISSLSFTSFLSIQKKSRLLPMFRGPRYVDIIKKVANFLTNLNPFRKLTSNTHLRVRGVQFATISHSLGWL